jgi:hypothetical protein
MQNLKNCKYWRTLSDIVHKQSLNLSQVFTALADANVSRGLFCYVAAAVLLEIANRVDYILYI